MEKKTQNRIKHIIKTLENIPDHNATNLAILIQEIIEADAENTIFTDSKLPQDLLEEIFEITQNIVGVREYERLKTKEIDALYED